MDKETRQELRRRCPTPEETDALLYMDDERDAKDEEIACLIDAQADTREALEQAERERDRYRELLEDVRGSLPAAGIPQSDGIWVPYSNNEWTLLCRRTEKIDAALEGKNDD